MGLQGAISTSDKKYNWNVHEKSYTQINVKTDMYFFMNVQHSLKTMSKTAIILDALLLTTTLHDHEEGYWVYTS